MQILVVKMFKNWAQTINVKLKKNQKRKKLIREQEEKEIHKMLGVIQFVSSEEMLEQMSFVEIGVDCQAIRSRILLTLCKGALSCSGPNSFKQQLCPFEVERKTSGVAKGAGHQTAGQHSEKRDKLQNLLPSTTTNCTYLPF